MNTAYLAVCVSFVLPAVVGVHEGIEEINSCIRALLAEISSSLITINFCLIQRFLNVTFLNFALFFAVGFCFVFSAWIIMSLISKFPFSKSSNCSHKSSSTSANTVNSLAISLVVKILHKSRYLLR